MTDFIKAYGALEVPEQFTISTFPEAAGEIREKADTFFQSVRRSLGMTAERFDVNFNELDLFTSRGAGYTVDHDTELRTLRLAGVQTLATVFDERNDNNIHVVSFLKHSLGARAVGLVQMHHRIARSLND